MTVMTRTRNTTSRTSVPGIAVPVSEKNNFSPSKYQLEIFTWVTDSFGNGIVDAVAGSGKTTTLVQIAKLLPSTTRSLFLAFNKSIVKELGARLPEGFEASTIHSAAMAALKRYLFGNKYAPKNWVSSRKYRDYIHYVDTSTRGLSVERRYATKFPANCSDPELLQDLYDNTADLLDMVRLTDTDVNDREAVWALALKYDLVTSDMPWTLNALPRLLDAGKEDLEHVIDFTDMIYWTVKLAGEFIPAYDFVMVDESQDLNRVQQLFVKALIRDGGRALFVGDPHQAIYGFAGADTDSMSRIKEEFACQQLHLSVCYRCPSSHIDAVKYLVPHIEAREGAPAGKIDSCRESEVSERVQRGDLIMCRVNAPLCGLAFDLIKAGIPAIVKGRNIAGKILQVLKQITKSRDYTWDDFQGSCDRYLSRVIETLSKRKDSDYAISLVTDQVECILAIYQKAKAEGHLRGKDDLAKVIDGMFTADDNADTSHLVTLSSVHKAKGLEADRTFVLRPNLMPHKMAKTEEAQEQEKHLIYVAGTRAKSELTYIYEDDKTGEATGVEVKRKERSW